MEDLHWVDPSTLEFLSLLIDQGPTARILTLCTFRPQFTPPWPPRSPIAQLTLTRLPRSQVGQMVTAVAEGKTVPAEVVQQSVSRSDGVPLFVEEMTKLVLASGLLREHEEGYMLTGPLPSLAIPATLQDTLMARLDQLASAKAVAQLGAVIGRQFSYELLRAVSPLDELALWRGLVQLVQAEVLYQRGVLPQATYLFKHALIQEVDCFDSVALILWGLAIHPKPCAGATRRLPWLSNSPIPQGEEGPADPLPVGQIFKFHTDLPQARHARSLHRQE